MPLAQRSSSSCAKMQTKLSSWTPLNHAPSNSKVFEERRKLLSKWCDRWSDSQRRAVLQDLVLSCSVEQLLFLSLSLWGPKCLRLGWGLTFTPTPLEQGVWKRLYIHSVQELRLTSLQVSSPQQQLEAPHVSSISKPEDLSEAVFISEGGAASISQPPGSISRTGIRKEKQPAPPPWRDSDRCPADTLRFNYLDNLEPPKQALKMRRTLRAPTCSSNTPKKSPSETHYKLRKAKSMVEHAPSITPPPPLLHDQPVTKETVSSLMRLVQWNAGMRPGPVRWAGPRPRGMVLRASQRSYRSPPSVPLFEVLPWTVPFSNTHR
ncbi:F-box only protein 16 [Dissostichus eleginoides]|uniref:F-box only protein 16 n=1 Tax=Dissostichus eleginoides TaxID=100907 RepID=A0AAD9BTW3_DISEL|nr:F-box only protein 16 [Dissostichus eleginoides]